MVEQEQTRLKVNKGVDSKARILNLTMTYLGLFAFFILIGVVILMVNFSFNLLIVVSIILAIVYMVIQYMNSINYFAQFQKSNIPDEYINDLF